MSTISEIETLLGQVALKDRAAFGTLYARTSAKLFGVTLRVFNNRAEAEEALQEIYFKIWQKADRYQVDGLSPMTWLITIARNHAIDRLRARRTRPGDLDEAVEIADATPGPEAQAIARSEAARIHACLDELPEARAQVVQGAYLAGETYADLAARSDVSLNTMRTWLRRSLQNLKDCLSR